MKLSRRRLLAGSPAIALGAAVAPGSAAAMTALSRPSTQRRAQSVFALRVKAANQHLQDAARLPPQLRNDDESRHPDFAGAFSKCLPHNADGLVDERAYRLLLEGLASNDFSDVVLARGAERKLANPSAADAYDLHGLDSHATRIEPSPSLAGAHAAAEMVEVYWQALSRDIPFADYASSPMIEDAAVELGGLAHPLAPRSGAVVTPETLFRGASEGDLVGPYISQLLWLPVAYGAGPFEQRYSNPVPGNDFMTTFDECVSIQNGRLPTRRDVFEPAPRYLQTARDLANYVHNDVLFQAYYNAAMILLGMGSAALAKENPFRRDAVEAGFVTFGGPDILNMMATSARLALTGAWYQKWLHRKLRPEAFAARVELEARGSHEFGLHPDVLTSEAVARVRHRQGNALLAQAFPEGAPTHPAYPAGHACVAGACATVLKAWFNEDYEFPSPVIPSADGRRLVSWRGPALRLGDEINKLASNISIGRNAAGVHYRSDGEQGMLAGEQQAIGLLRDYSLAYQTEFDGFRFRRFDGTSVRIVDGQVLA